MRVRTRRRGARVIGLFLCALLTADAWTLGCGGGGASPVAPPPPPPPPINVVVSPPSGSVLLGTTQAFVAAVSSTSNTGVTWSVNGIAGGNASVGTITAAGVYTAPKDLPPQTSVTITATSAADPSKSGSAQVSIASDIAVHFSSSSPSVELGAVASFSAHVVSAGNPDQAILYSVSGAGCSGAACGTVDALGQYTAPQILPSPAMVTLVAQSAADPAKQAAATIQITSRFTLTISGPASVAPGSSSRFTATFFPIQNSNPSLAVQWQLTGPGCTGSGCGSIGGTSAPGISSTANYTAPPAAPNPNTVTITAVPQADPTKAATMTVTIAGPPVASVQITPANATLAVNHRQTLTVKVTVTSSSTVNWQVNGIAGGNASVGQICVTGSSPCQALTSSSSATVDFAAPGGVPQPNPVAVTATSQEVPSAAASVSITILAHVAVSVSPPSATLQPQAAQQFTATVLGTSNQNVIWKVQGAACAGTGSPCGTVDANGLYTAPLAAPQPDSLQVVAVSSEDTSQSGFSQVTIATGPAITALLPASIFAGAAGGFTLRVRGSGFTASSPGPGSTIVAGGTARTTACPTSSVCTTTIGGADVAAAGNVAIQIKNADGTASNQVAFVVVPLSSGEDVMALSSAAPSATGKDIVAVEPSTAGTSAAGTNVDLNVAALGLFSIANNSCTLGGAPVVLARPASGTATEDICAFASSGLDAGMTYSVSGAGDVSVAGQQPAGLGIIHLTLQVSSTSAAGPRTLFIQNANRDKTAATGALVVK
ncbi:MAG TPA: hypothetical protein VEU31_00745 [Candidatus Acidoferrales bacterium]|nr:hypothetical protein [Candidatus Acidoferrales bacterium]